MSSSPYQSRLFSFLNRQSLRLRDRLGKTTRHLKVAAEWGVQMLVYPVYLLVQTGRLFGQKLDKTAEVSQLPAPEDNKVDLATPISVDQPIEKVLTLVDPWVIKETKTLSSASTPTVEQVSEQIQQRVQNTLEKRNPSNLAGQVATKIQKAVTGQNREKLKIQGIASLLDSQKLVLVADNNQSFNLLSPEQQDLLEKRIRRELANYYYEKRLYKLVGRHFPSLIPQFTEKDQNVLLPVRWFWRTMRWVQTSDVAISLNVFGESSLINPPLVREKIFDNPEFPQGEWGERERVSTKIPTQPDLSQLNALIHSAIDYFYGGLQKSPFANSRIVQQLPEASAIIQEKIEETAKLSQEKFIKPAASQLKQLKKQIYHQAEEPDPFRLQAILEAAIAYFFSESSPQKINHQSQNQLKSSSSDTEDPWLTPEDIFPQLLESKSSDAPLVSLPASSVVPATSSPKTSSDFTQKTNVTSTINKVESKVESKVIQVPTQPEINSSSSTQLSVPPVTENKTLSQAISIELSSPNQTHNAFSNIEFSPDWIETEVKTVGYVKHPLERLLKALDKIILWLEEILVKLWHKLRKLGQIKPH